MLEFIWFMALALGLIGMPMYSWFWPKWPGIEKSLHINKYLYAVFFLRVPGGRACSGKSG